MYWYYFQSARGVKIWWKKYITVMQITQFVIDLGKSCITMIPSHVANRAEQDLSTSRHGTTGSATMLLGYHTTSRVQAAKLSLLSSVLSFSARTSSCSSPFTSQRTRRLRGKQSLKWQLRERPRQRFQQRLRLLRRQPGWSKTFSTLSRTLFSMRTLRRWCDWTVLNSAA